MRVLVVDDSVVFRSQIKSALEENSEIVVVAVAANGKIALEKIEQNVVDIIIQLKRADKGKRYISEIYYRPIHGNINKKTEQ